MNGREPTINVVPSERGEGGGADNEAERLARVRELKQVVQEEHDFLMYELPAYAGAVLEV